MKRSFKGREQVIDIYRKQARHYDTSGIRGLEVWRRKAVDMLNLKRGDVVIDIGCGTGLNFPLLQEGIGPEGKIIGVDLTDAMLDQARRRIREHNWDNVELVQIDAAEYDFPNQVGGILSTFALTFVPDCGRVIQNGSSALAPGRRWVILDMAWPAGWPRWWRSFLFFLPSYGITKEVIQRHPWDTVWETMNLCLAETVRMRFWLGFFYLANGSKDE